MSLPFDGDIEIRPGAPRPGSRGAPLSVRELNERAEAVLADAIGTVWVTGEVTRFTAHANRHWYFQIKDPDGRGCIECVMFGSRNATVRFKPAVGMALLVQGTPGVYAAGGKFNLVVTVMEPAGAGAAALALEQLKQKLAAEGLFDSSRKKPLPKLPRTVGIVTSLDGAALRDVLNVLRRRFAGVSVMIAPATVQGAGAPPEIVAALRSLDRRGLDVLLLVRGGGAREDLAAFDDERVVRAVAACRTPIVTGVGHEIDTTLVDHAGDLRAPTPSAAAEIIVSEREELLTRVASVRQHLASAMRHRVAGLSRRAMTASAGRGLREMPRRVERARRDAAELTRRLEGALVRQVKALHERLRSVERRLSPEVRLQSMSVMRRRIENATAALGAAVRCTVDARRQSLQRAQATLHALSPLAVLARGYALVTEGGPSGPIVRDARDLRPGDRVHVRLAAGAAEADITRTMPSDTETNT